MRAVHDGKGEEEGTVPKKVLVLTGATAVGKTATSIQLAKELNGEIISADSVQVYRGLDIGSDKIKKEEMEGIPHHVIDILDPTEEFSAGYFYHLAKEAIEDILGRNKTPIVVGGTGFYLRWLVSGKPSTPTATKESEAKAREALEACFEKAQVAQGEGSPLTVEEKWKAGVDLVRSLGDSETADRLLHQEVNNWYRMNRVVDILLQAPGKTLAELDRDDSASPEYDFRCFFLVRPRIQLYRRIDERVEVMLAHGLITETAEKLCPVAEADSNCATRAIGYRQTMFFLDRWASRDVNDLAEKDIIDLAKDIQTASRQLCHKQMHWFRKEEKFRWIQADGLTRDDLVQELIHHWEKDEHQGGGALKRNRLTKEEEKELKLYIPEIKHLTGDCLKQILDEARKAINTLRT
ncbi:hypothetical protein M9434_000699 [Picochlorum sp. BPE23]|nr:hypothetical protein M9434_000699 [Picochlorum sp. BPE23]